MSIFDTLADRLKHGAIPVEEALKLASQIAEALEAAHEKGVIHRDLKPANIKVTPDGKVKVLDFGLAKAFAGQQTEVNPSNSPTLSYTATQQGMVLGTAAYMSPEQARGKPVDKRADIWAFGCVLYEMLTGRVAFKGLCLRSLNEFDAKLNLGTDTNTSSPFFSPDGKWIGYFSGADGKLKKIAVSGGAPMSLCDTASVMGASWSADDTIVYADYGTGIWRVSASGGTPELIVKEEAIAMFHPQLLPDGKSLLVTIGNAPPYKIIVQSLQSGERKELFAGDNARYIPTGHIVYALENNLFAVPFNLKTQEVAGGSVPVVEGVYRVMAGVTPQYAVSDSGTLVYMPGTTAATPSYGNTLVWVDRNGREEPLAIPPAFYAGPRISPDGMRVVLARRFESVMYDTSLLSKTGFGNLISTKSQRDRK